jgi:hypothetical protein
MCIHTNQTARYQENTRITKKQITPRPDEHYNEGLHYTREMLGS